MAAIQFDASLETGIEEVDEQHRALVEIYNRLDTSFEEHHANRDMGEILARLFQYTKTHFASEEALMERYEFEGLEAHRKEHTKLVEQLRKFIVRFKNNEERISREMLDFVRNWVVHHISESDMAFSQPILSAMAGSRETSTP